MTSFSIQNFGCRTNQAEAFEWAAELEACGLPRRAEGQGSVVVVNTCTLTSRADRDVKKFIRRVGRANPEAKVVVTGCLAERDPESLRRLPGVWKVVPNARKDGLPAAVLSAGNTGTHHLYVLKSGHISDVSPRPPFRARGLVKVQDGCDQACRFCIIPLVRGRSRSLARDIVLDRVRSLVERGSAEIVLTGINLGAYGLDLRPRASLLDLLGEVESLPGDFRVRLSSIDPRFLPRPLVEAITRFPKVCPHFHLSLQHASDRVLRAMGRPGSADEYRALLLDLAARSPEAALGADFIVGFPGESEEEFEAAASFVLETPLSYVHVFSFSPRPGTPAAGDAPVEESVKSRRASLLRLAGRRKDFGFRRRFEGRTLGGVVIRRSAAGGRVLTGPHIEVSVPPLLEPVGAPVRVRVDRVSEGGTGGEIVPAPSRSGHG
jgi:threonylcarbamoyladenosine tRNA methylthiotransferase MtaB